MPKIQVFPVCPSHQLLRKKVNQLVFKISPYEIFLDRMADPRTVAKCGWWTKAETRPAGYKSPNRGCPKSSHWGSSVCLWLTGCIQRATWSLEDDFYVQSKMLSTFQTSKWFCHSQQRKKEPSQSTSFPLWWAFRDGSYQENKLKRTLGHSNNETIPKLLSATQIIPFWLHISWAWPFYTFNCNCACLTSNNVAGVDLLQVSVRRA